MPQHRVGVLIDLQDKISKELTRVQRELKSFEKGFKETSKVLGDWGKGMTLVGVGLSGLLIKTGLTAARVEVLGTALNAMGRTAGYSREELKKHEEAVKSLGIATREAREILARFIGAELDLADAAKLARTAQDLAVIAGENSSETAARLTEAIGAQSVMMLRQYGITTTSTKIFEDYANTLGKTAEDLTETEKKQAFLNKILQEGTKYVGVYEEAMGDVGKQIGTLTGRLIPEFEAEFGEAFLPVMGKAVQMATDFLKAYSALSAPLRETITQATILGTAFSLIVGSLLILISKMISFSKQIRVALGIVKAFILALTPWSGVFIAIAFWISIVIGELVKFSIEIGSLSRAWSLTLIELQQRFVNAGIIILDTLRTIGSHIPIIGDRLEGVDRAISDLGQTSRELESEFDALVQQGLEEELENIKKESEEVAEGLDRMGDETNKMSKAMKKAFEDAVKGVKEIRDEIKEAYREMADANKEYGKEVLRTEESFREDVVGLVADASDKMEKLEKEKAEIIEKYSKQITEAERRGQFYKTRKIKETQAKELKDVEAQIKEQEAVLKSYHESELDLEKRVIERREYLKMNEFDRLVADHKKKLLMVQKEHLEDQILRIQRVIELTKEHNTAMAFIGKEKEAAINAEIEKTRTFREQLQAKKDALVSWIDEVKAIYQRYTVSMGLLPPPLPTGAPIEGERQLGGPIIGTGAHLLHKGEYVVPEKKVAGNTFHFDFSGAFIGNLEDFKKQVIELINRDSELKELAGQ